MKNYTLIINKFNLIVKMSGELGEVEIKLNALVKEVFDTCETVKEGDDTLLTKDSIKKFLLDAFEKAGQTEAWSDEEFDECYREFDYDGSGTISEGELMQFIKRFAAL